jgi:hypothetical protein
MINKNSTRGSSTRLRKNRVYHHGRVQRRKRQAQSFESYFFAASFSKYDWKLSIKQRDKLFKEFDTPRLLNAASELFPNIFQPKNSRVYKEVEVVITHRIREVSNDRKVKMEIKVRDFSTMT